MVICSPQLGLNPNSPLGGEVFDREILLGLTGKGVKIEVFLPKGKPYDKNIKNMNFTLIPISHFPAVLYNLLIIPYLYSINQKRKFAIIRIHQPQFIGFGCLFFKLFHPQVKLIATYHQFGESNFGPFSKIINNLWDHLICDSQNVKNKIIKSYKVSPDKITVVHNGVPKYLKPAAKDKKLLKKFGLEGKIVLLFMGLFIERKNPLFLLDLLSKISQTGSDLVLIFWGQGPLEKEIIKKAKSLGIWDKIRIQKPIYGPDKNKIHNIADIFVHSSLDEGFALAPLEAMACAKPVVITSGYSAKEAVEDGINGYLCHASNLDEWSNKIRKLIDNPRLRTKMGQEAFTKVKKAFQWKYAVEKHIEVFKKISP